MMKQKTFQFAFALMTALSATACLGVGFSQHYFMQLARVSSAERLFGKGDYEAAQAAFEQLAAQTDDPVEASKFKARAAIALGSREDEYDSGIEKAKAIALRPYSVYAQIELMRNTQAYESIISTFGDADIHAWPDYEVPGINYRRWRTSSLNVKVYVYRARGQAFHETGNGEAADRDLSRAADLCEGKSQGDHALKLDILTVLARNAAELLDDETKAFEAQRRIVWEANRIRGDAQYMQVVVSVAARLRHQGAFQEALDVLNQANLKNRSQRDSWFGTGHLAYGRVYAAKTQALQAEAERLEKEGQNQQAAELLAEAETNKANARAHFKTLADATQARESHREAADAALHALTENNP